MQIHADIDSAFWLELLGATDKWPETSRTRAHITRYAMSELLAELPFEKEGLIPTEPAPAGDFHMQARARTPEEEADWSFLAEKYGSLSTAAKIALAFLYESLRHPEVQ